MKWADVDACEREGLDAAKVESIARRFATAARDAHRAGLYVFGGSGYGTLRIIGRTGTSSEVAHIGEGFDGGDGGDR